MVRANSSCQSVIRLHPKPTQMQSTALLFHSVGGDTFVTQHAVENNQLQAGNLVDGATVEKLVLSKQLTDSSVGIIPHKVLVNNDKTLIWHKPAQYRTMWFTKEVSKAKPMGVKVWWPNLIFVISKDTGYFRVFATATGARPKENTIVYHVPLMNINSTGSLCLGTATMPKHRCIDTIEQMEAVLMDSKFSHLNHKQQTSRKHYHSNKSHYEFWYNKSLSRNKVRQNDLLRLCSFKDILKATVHSHQFNLDRLLGA